MPQTPLSLPRPADDYDREAWLNFYETNPGYRRSAGADAAEGGDAGGGGEGSATGDGGDGESSSEATPPDYSFLPEAYRKEGADPDIEGFKAHYDELASFKAQTDEAKGEIPEAPDGYTFAIPEDFEAPEGISVEIKDDDPDLPALKEWAHQTGVSQQALNGLAKILAGREARAQVEAQQTYNAEMESLGADAKSRLETINRRLGSRLPADQAEALMGATYSAGAVKALEKLLSGPGGRASTPTSTVDTSKMTPAQMIEEANRQSASGPRRRAG